MSIYFIAGIDTGVGKTVITGLMAKYLLDKGNSVITQKIVQTGTDGISDDIILHRKIMGIEMTDDDLQGITCSYVFKYPASPHLASRLENTIIETSKIANCTKMLSDKYDNILLEGVGGMHVPLRDNYTTLDYIEEKNYPVILISSSKLGSINQTLLNLEVAKKRNLKIQAIIYNLFPGENHVIVEDSKNVFKESLKFYGYLDTVIEIPVIKNNYRSNIDFSKIFMHRN